MTERESPIPVLDGIATLAPTSDAWLVDIWGVMHNGVAAFVGAADACRRFRSAGGTVVLLSNAPRPAPAALAQLDRIGVPRDAFDAIVTSGDLTRGLVSSWKDRRIHHLGPERDIGIFAGLDVPLVASVDAEIVVCTGFLDDETETVEDYATTLKGFLRRGAVMICANPDLRVERGNRLVPCAGALAQSFEQMGGTVVYAGKPHPPVYDLALGTIAAERKGPVDKARVLAIGDGVKTDIAGAAGVGIRSVFIASAVDLGTGGHAAGLDPATLAGLFAGQPQLPVGAMAGLKW